MMKGKFILIKNKGFGFYSKRTYLTGRQANSKDYYFIVNQ